MRYCYLLIIFWVSTFALQAQQPSPCTQYEVYRELDFWVGNWKVEDSTGAILGYSSIEVILDSCVIFENWRSAKTYKGKSLNYYNRQTKKWHQKWIDNYSNPLEFEGEVKDHAITYIGKTKDPQGNEVIQKMTISKVDDNKVQQVWESSTDGQSWKLLFNGIYIRQTHGQTSQD